MLFFNPFFQWLKKWIRCSIIHLFVYICISDIDSNVKACVGDSCSSDGRGDDGGEDNNGELVMIINGHNDPHLQWLHELAYALELP